MVEALNGALADEPTDELVRAAKKGDVEAWNRLDRRYRIALTLFTRGRIPAQARSRFDTEDVMQSALLSAYRELESYEYRGEGSFYSWLTRIIRNRLNSRVRDLKARKRDAGIEQRYTESHALGDEPASESPSELYSTAEEHARVIEAITKLKDEQREVLTRHVIDRRTLTQVALDLGLSPTTAKRRRVVASEAFARQVGA